MAKIRRFASNVGPSMFVALPSGARVNFRGGFADLNVEDTALIAEFEAFVSGSDRGTFEDLGVVDYVDPIQALKDAAVAEYLAAQEAAAQASEPAVPDTATAAKLQAAVASKK